MPEVEIYTDGACSCNPGPGGWGVVCLTPEGSIQAFSGFMANTTNNYMELTAAIEGLKRYVNPHKIKLYSDSAYLINAFNQNWIDNWLKNNFRTADKKPVKNKELWQQLIQFNNFHTIQWIKVKGHADNKYNNMCDELARKQIEANVNVD